MFNKEPKSITETYYQETYARESRIYDPIRTNLKTLLEDLFLAYEPTIDFVGLNS